MPYIGDPHCAGAHWCLIHALLSRMLSWDPCEAPPEAMAGPVAASGAPCLCLGNVALATCFVSCPVCRHVQALISSSAGPRSRHGAGCALFHILEGPCRKGADRVLASAACWWPTTALLQ